MINANELCERFGVGKTTLWRHMKKGVLTKDVLMSNRDRAWPLYEIEAIEIARIANWDDDKLIVLVSRLMDRRQANAQAMIEKLMEVNQ